MTQKPAPNLKQCSQAYLSLCPNVTLQRRVLYLLVACLLERLDERVQRPQHSAGRVLADLGHDLVAEHLHVRLGVAQALNEARKLKKTNSRSLASDTATNPYNTSRLKQEAGWRVAPYRAAGMILRPWTSAPLATPGPLLCTSHGRCWRVLRLVHRSIFARTVKTEYETFLRRARGHFGAYYTYDARTRADSRFHVVKKKKLLPYPPGSGRTENDTPTDASAERAYRRCPPPS